MVRMFAPLQYWEAINCSLLPERASGVGSFWARASSWKTDCSDNIEANRGMQLIPNSHCFLLHHVFKFPHAEPDCITWTFLGGKEKDEQ